MKRWAQVSGHTTTTTTLHMWSTQSEIIIIIITWYFQSGLSSNATTRTTIKNEIYQRDSLESTVMRQWINTLINNTSNKLRLGINQFFIVKVRWKLIIKGTYKIFLVIWQWNNFENWCKFAQVSINSHVSCFFRDTVYINNSQKINSFLVIILHCISKRFHLWLAVTTTWSDVWQKCYRGSKKSKDSSLSSPS